MDGSNENKELNLHKEIILHSPFNGQVFKDFCETFGIEHTPITPVHPEANGQAEVFMKNMNKIVKNANANQSKVIKVHHVSNNKYKMLVIQALSKNRQANRTMKKYADEKRKAVKAEFQTGEKVILDQIKNKKIYNKFSDRWASTQYKVVGVKGSMITIADPHGRTVTRDASWIKRGSPAIPESIQTQMTTADQGSSATRAPELEAQQLSNSVEIGQEPPASLVMPGTLEVRAKSSRIKNPIKRLGINE